MRIPSSLVLTSLVLTSLVLTLPVPAAVHAAGAAGTADTLVPVAAFFDNPRMSDAKLAPDGKRLAMLVNSDKGRDRLAVVTLPDLSIKVVAEFNDGDVGRFEWVNDNRLIYDSHDKNTPPGRRRFWTQRYGRGLFAVNADGSGYVKLVATFGWVRKGNDEGLDGTTYMMDQAGAQDSNAVYVESAEFDPDGSLNRINLGQIDTVTGFTKRVESPGRTREWWLDAKGRPALATTVEGNVETLHVRDPKDGRWRALATTDAFLGSPGDFAPLGFAPDGTLYVTSRQERDKAAPFTFDLATGKLAARPLVDLDAFDFRGELVASDSKLLGIRYLADAESVAWFDPAMKAAQETVDKLLPGRVNVLSVGRRSTTPYMLVQSWSDRQPSVFLLFDRETGQLSKIGDSRPGIAPARMAAQDLTVVKARDGRGIPTWMTIPAGSQGRKLPMVVLVHGGPNVRGHAWGWNGQSQFLASRGYLVLEPEFRGSTGYGHAHYEAGWKQWGLAMQDDVADATRWAIAQGLADPRRICIAGASYGGYATLMGLIRDPDLYKCGIDWVGVTDIGLMYNGHWTGDDDTSDAVKRYSMPTTVGDPVKDAAQFAATSPIRLASRIAQPLLLAYGGYDQRVPIYHGRLFRDAVMKTNREVEWVEYEEEGHGWTLVGTRLDFWGRVERFLQKHIGGGAQ